MNLLKNVILVLGLFIGLVGTAQDKDLAVYEGDEVNTLVFPIQKALPIPQSVKSIVGEGAKTDTFKDRLKLVHRLNRTLHLDQINALWWYLHRIEGDCEAKKSVWNCPLTIGEVNVIKNDISTALMNQRSELREFPAHFIYMFQRKCVSSEVQKCVSEVSNQTNPEQVEKKCTQDGVAKWCHDKVWRDYCIQFLGQWMEKYSDIKSNKLIEHCFRAALLEKGNSIAGTTLIACNNNRDRLSETMSKVFKVMAIRIVTDVTYGEASRIAAFQVCAMNDFKESLPTIRKVVATGTSACLKMSAIAALGVFGKNEDLVLIKKASKSYDSRIRKAAYAALKKLK